MSKRKIAYLKKEFKSTFSILQEWKLYEGAQGCTPLDIAGLGLSMDKTPPPLPFVSMAPPQPKPPYATPSITPAPKPAPAPPKDPILIGAWKEIKEWSSKTDEDGNQKLPPPFDILDIPEGMKAMDFPTGKKFADRWLNGRSYMAPTSREELKGVIYPKDMIDADTIKMSWLLGFNAVESRYEELKDNLIFTPNAKIEITKSLVRFLSKNPRFQGTLHTKSVCNDDIQQLHQLFQFQKNTVSDFDTLKNGSMTDLTASLGNFNFYSAIANADITTDIYNKYNTPSGTLHCTKSRATITHVWIYAKDSYNFKDDAEVSQYLGHWNKRGIIILPIPATSAILNKFLKTNVAINDASFSSIRAVTTGDFIEKDVYYPIYNKNYNQYREKHKRGGDFIIYSDLKKIQLDRPVFISLEEVCYSNVTE